MRYPVQDPATGRNGRQPAVLVATEAVLLWPREIRSPATADEAGVWPVFVLVVSERPPSEIPSAAPLLELVNHPLHGGGPVIATTRCRWSVVDARNALLKVAVRAEAPEPFSAEILVPARHVLGVLDVVARGATIGVTTARHSAQLVSRVDIRHILEGVVLLSCSPSAELARLATLMRCAVDPG
jgi:hypothetical protein